MKSIPLKSLSRALIAQLQQTETRLVLAESCTCGLVAATLGAVPGVSQWLCGSAVVYQEETKSAWLGIPARSIKKHGVVSGEIARAMAAGVLRETPQADVAVSVTGHLGPNAPLSLDGVVYVGFAKRRLGAASPRTASQQVTLPEVPSIRGATLRVRRQRAAAVVVLKWALDCLLPHEPDNQELKNPKPARR